MPLGRREVNTLAVRAGRGGGRKVDGDVSGLDRLPSTAGSVRRVTARTRASSSCMLNGLVT